MLGDVVELRLRDEAVSRDEVAALLADDRCQCAHLGYELKGKVEFTFAGGAYHAPPGHTPTMYAGTEIVEFSPPSRCNRRSRS